MGYVFISYSSKDMKIVETVNHLLQKQKIDTVLIRNRGGFQNDIPAAVEGAACVLLIHSQHTMHTQHVLSELSMRMDFNIPLFVLCAEDTSPEELHKPEHRKYLYCTSGAGFVSVESFDEQSRALCDLIEDIRAAIEWDDGQKKAQRQRLVSDHPGFDSDNDTVDEKSTDTAEIADRSDVEPFEIVRRRNGKSLLKSFTDPSSLSALVPEGVEEIGEEAFAGSSVRKVTLPSTLMVIRKRAFANCKSLRVVEFPESVDCLEIMDEAFSGCVSLRTEMPEGAILGKNVLSGTPIQSGAQKSSNPEENNEYVEKSSIGSQPAAQEEPVPEKKATGSKPESEEEKKKKEEDKRAALSAALAEALKRKKKQESAAREKTDDPAPPVQTGENKAQPDREDEQKPEEEKPASLPQDAEDPFAAFEYTKDGKSVVIRKLRNALQTVVIVPEGTTHIAEAAFRDCSGIRSIELPRTLSEIGRRAFENCRSLESVVIPAGVRRIESGTFAGCRSLEKAVLPEKLTEIAENAFKGCSLLQKADLPAALTKIGYSAFEECAALQEISIPRGVTVLPWNVFAGCRTLQSVSLPEGLTQIDRGAFSGCGCLGDPLFPATLTEIGKGAFENCATIRSLRIPAATTSIKDNAFLGCSSLKTIEVDPANSVYRSVQDCLVETEEKKLILGGGEGRIPQDGSVTAIEEDAFRGRLFLQEIFIPACITRIGKMAFAGCENLVSILVASKNADYTAVDNCLIKKSDRSLLRGCSTSVIPADGSVTKIAWYAFYGSAKLVSVEIPAKIESIGKYVFAGCTELSEITVHPDNPNYSGAGNCLVEKATSTLIAGCKGSVIPADGSVTVIAEGAFDDCRKLTRIRIPKSVQNVERGAFGNCTALESILVQAANPVYHSEGNCLIHTESKTLVLGCRSNSIPDDGSVTAIGSFAYKGLKNVRSLVIPAQITEIGYGAFRDCGYLTVVLYTGSEAQWKEVRVSQGNEALQKAEIRFNV